MNIYFQNEIHDLCKIIYINIRKVLLIYFNNNNIFID